MNIRSLNRWGILSLGLALTLNAPMALAQQPGMQRGPARQRMNAPRLMEQLNLTPAQKKRLDALMKKNRASMLALRNNTKLTPEQKRSKAMALRESQMKQITAMLTPTQAQKLKQLRAEQSARFARNRGERRGDRQRLVLERMKDELKLTPSQESRIRAILKKSDAEQDHLRSRQTSTNGPDPALRTRMRELRRTTMEQIQAVLTPQQRQKSREAMQQRRGQMGKR